MLKRPRAEDGMTLIEVSVAMTLSIIVLLMMFLVLTVFSKSEASTTNSADAAAFTRLALLQFQHDVQSAVSFGAESSATTYEDTLQVTLATSGSVVTWQYTPSNGKLTRQVGTSAPKIVLTNVTNGLPPTVPPTSGTGISMFHYYDHCFNDLVSEAQNQSAQSAAAIIDPTVTVVQITLAVANLDSAPYGTTTSVNVMNRSPGSAQCG